LAIVRASCLCASGQPSKCRGAPGWLIGHLEKRFQTIVCGGIYSSIFNLCMYEGWAKRSSPCTATFNDLLCFPFRISFNVTVNNSD
jgi:hypothetical protein